MKLLLFFFYVMFSGFSIAQTNIHFLKAESNLLILSLDENKSHVVPNCVDSESSSLWAIDIQTDEGKAALVLVNMAIGSQLTIAIESAGECVLNSGIERIKDLSLVVQQ